MVIAGLPDSLDANASVLAAGRRVGPADDLSLAGLIGEPVVNLSFIGRTVGGGRCRLALVGARDAEMRYSRVAFHRAPRLTRTGVGPCGIWR